MEKVKYYLDAPELFTRSEHNPILTPSDWPYKANAVFNPGAVEYNGETVLMVRVEDMNGLSHLTKAVSKNGETDWRIDSSPTIKGESELFPEEMWGIEDSRVVRLDELNEYAVVYTSFSKSGPLVSLAMTKDFQTFTKKGIIMKPEDKDASLFPKKFNNCWALIHRPMPSVFSAKANIWISFSPDLKYWGDHSVLLEARDGAWWDANKIGLGPQPIETSEGWLIIYHGVRKTAAGDIYRVGLALLDLEDPRKVVRRSNEWVFGPKESYERVGDVSDVTFPCGIVYDKETDELSLYYGAADTVVALAKAILSDVLEYLKGSL